MPRTVWLLLIALVAGCLSPASVAPPTVDLAAATTVEPDDLAKAAECLDRGEEAQATQHLTRHVTLHPTEVMTRAYLAELLYRQGQWKDAEEQFNRVVQEAQGLNGKAKDHCVHCHTRLMQIAEATENTVGEQLHRGIGLVLLVRRWEADTARHDATMAERTLVQAVRALREAEECGNKDPRGPWYLAEALQKLGQPTAASQARALAKRSPPGALREAETDISGVKDEEPFAVIFRR